MSASVLGRIDWNGTRDKDGHRDYDVSWLVVTTDVDDGPVTVLSASGLPSVGVSWGFGNDLDLWAFCSPEMEVTPVLDRERNVFWIVKQRFSTRPLNRCQDTDIENPLDEPPTVAGSFVKYTKECVYDRHGDKIAYSNHQLIQGPLAEFDHNRPTVQIGLNVPTLNLALITGSMDTVNDANLWGLQPRQLKLSNVSWARRLYGTCSFYYTLQYDFDVDFNTFDRDVVDEGTMILAPGGDPNKPEDFIQYKDCRGNNQRILLDGAGSPLADGSNPVSRHIEYYPESNFLLLGIPTSL